MSSTHFNRPRLILFGFIILTHFAVMGQSISINNQKSKLITGQKNLILTDLSKGNLLNIKLDSTNTTRTQIGPIIPRNDNGKLSLIHTIDNQVDTLEIGKHFKTNKKITDFTLRLDNDITQIILEVYGNSNLFIIYIEDND